MVMHWNGTSWTQVPSPASNFSAVTFTSPANGWVVGSNLIARWNGTSWQQVASPSGNWHGVAATSPANAWAVGRGTHGPVIAHWNGTAWKHVPTPAIGNGDLAAVTATSATDAWAVGCISRSGCTAARPHGRRTLILHWNGTAWKQVPSPNPAGGNNNDQLFGVAATSTANAWAVGLSTLGVATADTLIAHWNGRAWKQVPSPNASTFNLLDSVAAVSARNVWAVGYGANVTLAEHWNGTGWTQVASPNPGAFVNALSAVAARPPADVWVLGLYGFRGMARRTMVLHRC